MPHQNFWPSSATADTEAAAAAELVEKLVDTLNSNREPSPEYPSIRRVLVEVIISIVELCPGYRKILQRKGGERCSGHGQRNPIQVRKVQGLSR